MSQQINLLQRRAKTSTTPWGSLAAIVAIIVVIVMYGSSTTSRTTKLKEQVGAGEGRVAQLRKTMQTARTAEQPRDSVAAIDAELAELRPRAQAAGELVGNIRRGEVGTTEGFSKQLALLSTVAREDIWITALEISRGGKEMVVTGRALGNEQAVQYARRLNEMYEPFGVQFRSIELKPDPLLPAGAPPTMLFKLW
jgi:hypothetical protein